MGDKQFQAAVLRSCCVYGMITAVKQLPLLRLRDDLNALTTDRMANRMKITINCVNY